MKLIYCPKCKDVVNLRVKQHRTCWCGASGGEYVDNLNAVIEGEAVPLGINNASFIKALSIQPDEGLGSNFKAFVIPKKCPTISQAPLQVEEIVESVAGALSKYAVDGASLKDITEKMWGGGEIRDPFIGDIITPIDVQWEANSAESGELSRKKHGKIK